MNQSIHTVCLQKCKPWYKNIRLHVLVIVSTALCMMLSVGLWGTKKIVFQLKAHIDKPAVYQLFYTETPEQKFSEERLIQKNVPAGETRLSFDMAADKIDKIRLVMANLRQKNTMRISEISIHGDRYIEISEVNEWFNIHRCNLITCSGDAFVLETVDEGSPHIIIKKDLNIHKRLCINYYLFFSLLAVFLLISWKLVYYLALFKTRDRASRIDIVFLLLCTVVLCSPISNISKDQVSHKEKRTLAKAPELSKVFDDSYQYGKKYESWLNDHFFGREFFIELHRTHISALCIKGNDNVIRGKDGWIFYKKIMKNYMNSDSTSDALLTKSADYIWDIQNYCQQRGKQFVYFLCPEKHQIYGEHYSRSVRKVKPDDESMVNRFLAVLKNKNINYVYPLDELLEEKKKGNLLYWKNDTHWNAEGAYVGYKALIEKLNHKDVYELNCPAFVNIRKHPVNDITKYPILMGNDLVTMWPNAPQDNHDGYMAPLVSDKITYSDNNIGGAKLLICRNPDKKKKMVIFRDSFTTRMAPYINETFGEVVYIWRYDVRASDLDQYLKDADVVVLENVARFIPILGKNSFPQ